MTVLERFIAELSEVSETLAKWASDEYAKGATVTDIKYQLRQLAEVCKR